jgi:hypothetical protein
MKNDFCKIIFHPQTPLALNVNKFLCLFYKEILREQNGLQKPFYSLNTPPPRAAGAGE